MRAGDALHDHRTGHAACSELLRAHVLQRAAPRLWKRPACLAVPTSSDPALPRQLSCSPRTMQIAEL